MSKEPIGFVSHGTIGRTRSGRPDPVTGVPLDEMVPSRRGERTFDRHGNELHTPTHCHRAFVLNLDDKYKPRIIRDLLKEGSLQEGRCPHMPREQLGDKPSMPAPKDFVTCDGKGSWAPDWMPGVKPFNACKHLVAAVTARHDRAVAEAEARKGTAGREALLAMAHTIGKQAHGMAVAEAVRKPAPPAAQPGKAG